MKSYKNYNRYDKEKKDVFTWILAAILLCLIVLGVLTVCGVLDDVTVTWKPIASYPMTNQHIEWSYAGKVLP